MLHCHADIFSLREGIENRQGLLRMTMYVSNLTCKRVHPLYISHHKSVSVSQVNHIKRNNRGWMFLISNKFLLLKLNEQCSHKLFNLPIILIGTTQ